MVGFCRAPHTRLGSVFSCNDHDSMRFGVRCSCDTCIFVCVFYCFWYNGSLMLCLCFGFSANQFTITWWHHAFIHSSIHSFIHSYINPSLVYHSVHLPFWFIPWILFHFVLFFVGGAGGAGGFQLCRRRNTQIGSRKAWRSSSRRCGRSAMGGVDTVPPRYSLLLNIMP